MNLSTRELLDFVKENDIKFIRLSFVDLDGNQKNLSVMSDELENCLDAGVVFDGAVAGFDKKNGDLKLYPDIDTLHILPWRPQHGRVARFLCKIKDLSGKTVDFDCRELLTKSISKLKKLGFNCELGIDSEFYLFKTDEEGYPTKNAHDSAGYFDIAPLDKGENVRREICLTLEEMGIKPLSSHHEKGPGQNEINFYATDALSACDNQVIFKSVVKAVASRNGLFASFMPKPMENVSGNGLAVNIDLFKDKKPFFAEEKLGLEADGFIAGVLNRAREMSLFFNTIPNSYERLGEFEAPDAVEFSSSGDRSRFSRFAFKGKEKKFEMRSLDGACNIHLVTSLIINAGVEGIKNREMLKDFQRISLPHDMSEAIKEAEKSEFLKDCLGASLLNDYLNSKRLLQKQYMINKAQANKNAFERI